MTRPSALVFDFDGVIIDGIHEYWASARKACLKLLGIAENSEIFPTSVPTAFQDLRPWVHHGWEMVVICAELHPAKGILARIGTENFQDNYSNQIKQSLSKWRWEPRQVQNALEESRRLAIANEKETWISRHYAFPWVIERLNSLNKEGIKIVILTTKGVEFTNEILKNLRLITDNVFGHEAGSKPDVLLNLVKEASIIGFIEDRLKTLESIRATPGLQSIPCYLANWGYLKPNDSKDLPKGIHLLEKNIFSGPLASWH